MAGILQASDAWLPWLATVTWQTAVLALMAWTLLKVAGKRLSPRAHYAVWGVVVLRLVLPPLPELSIGLSPTTGAFTTPTAAVEAIVEPVAGNGAPPIRTPRRAFGAKESPRVPTPDEPAHPVEPTSAEALGRPRVVHAAVPPLDSEVAPGRPGWPAVVLTCWGVVALLVAIRMTGRDLRFRRALRASGCASKRLDERIPDCAVRLGIDRKVEGIATPLVRSPAVYGVLRPKVLVPPHLLDSLDDAELSHVLLHELAHARRHDVLVNQALVLLRALHWFNPVAHFALARLEAAREAVRDLEVLASRDAPAPAAYGRTLLRLLETCQEPTAPRLRVSATTVGAVRSSSDITWRITMISRFAHRRPLGLVLSVACVVLLGGAALVGASARPVDLGTTPREDDPTVITDEIRVIRESEAPAWRVALRKTLSNRVDLAFKDADIDDVVTVLRSKYQLNVVVNEDIAGEYAGEPLRFEARGVELGVALRSMLRRIDASYALVDGVLYIDREDACWVTERRIYNVDPLVGRDGDAAERLRHLRDLLHEVFASAWEHEGTYTRDWNGLLCIAQSPEMHERIHAFMNRLLRGGEGRTRTAPEWRTRLSKAIEQKVSVEFGHDKTVGDMLDHLGSVTGVPFIVHLDHTEREFTLELKDVPLRTVLDWMGRRGGFRWEIGDGGIRIAERHRYRLGYYKLGSLLDSGPGTDGDEEELREALVDIFRESVNPPSWEEEGALVVFWRDLMIVNQTEATHAGLERFLAALRKARQ